MRLSLVITLAVTLLISCFASQAVNAGAYDATANACSELKQRTGWGCDDPVSRSVWRALNWLRGVHDCNSLCIRMGHRSGSCRADRPQKDVSTWCPRGQTCICSG